MMKLSILCNKCN